MTLDENIKQAYQLFAKYKAKFPLDICTGCCVSKEEEKQLLELKASEIIFNTLCSYTDSAKNGVAPHAEVLHFLPRYFEFIADFKYPSFIAAETSFRLLEDLDWGKCSPQEQQLIEQFGLLFFKKYLTVYPTDESIDAILILLDNGLHFNSTKLLQLWAEENTVASHFHLRDLYYYKFCTKLNTLANSFSKNKFSTQVYHWCHSSTFILFKKAQLETLFKSTEANAWQKGVFEELWEFYEYLAINSGLSK